MRILIVDDEPLARRRMRSMLDDLKEIEVVGGCESAEEALEAIPSHKPDVIFLDIQMPGIGGLALAEQLKAEDAPAVVFVTAHSEHALAAFEVAAVDYLLKPFSKQRLAATLDRLESRLDNRRSADLTSIIEELSGTRYPDRIPVPGRARVVFVDVESIDRVEADGNYVVIHAGQETHLLRAYLSDMEARLDPNRFLRVHRSHLVRRDRIRELRTAKTGALSVVLSDGTRLPVGRKYASGLMT